MGTINRLNKGVLRELTEGDIILYPEDDETEGENEKRGNAIRDRNRLWHNRDIAYSFRKGKSILSNKMLIDRNGYL